MSSIEPKTTYLNDYQPPAFLIPSIHLHFYLHSDATIVKSNIQLEKNPDGPNADAVILHGNDLQLMELKLNGQLLNADMYDYDGKILTIPTQEKTFTIETYVKISPKTNYALEGLYLSNGIYCSHCEPESFRNITFFIDRPDVLSKYTTTIRAKIDSCPILLANGNVIESGRDKDEHWATYEDPFLKPSYLFALVAGDLESLSDEFITQSGRKIQLKIFAIKQHIQQCQFALSALKRAMRWDEIHYGREYDLDQYYIVAVEDFNSGAMENKGLNIFNTSCLLADPSLATDNDFFRVESVVAHEYFHNWSGNRVTCRDWFQLSLKEGFTVFREQQFASTLHTQALQRIDDVNMLMSVQFPEDDGPLAHPVRPDRYQEISNFYTATIYEKGAEVIRMLFSLLGETNFRKGTDLYFKRHDGHAVTTDDFVQAIADANQIDLTDFKRWYVQAGTPRVVVNESFDEAQNIYSLHFEQSCPKTPGQAVKLPFVIPIKLGLLDKHGAELNLSQVDHPDFYPQTNTFLLSHSEDTLTLKGITEKPIPSLLREFSAPVKLQFSYANEQLIHLLKYETDGFNQWFVSRKLLFNAFTSSVEQKPFSIHPDFFTVYQTLLEDILAEKHQIDIGLMARMLTLPTQRQFYEQFNHINVDLIEKNRQHMKKQFSDYLTPLLLKIYEKFSTKDYEFNQVAVAKRALKNACLKLLGETDMAKDFAFNQFTSSSNMTDRSAALNCIVNYSDQSIKQQVLNQFYNDYQHHALVIDEWFACQARSEQVDVIQTIEQLTQHNDFNIKNPNRVRALIGTFVQYNLANFHQIQGKGYDLLKQMIMDIDQFNPKVAARLVSAFSQWKKLDEMRQQKIQAALVQISQVTGLSADTREMVEKSLSAEDKCV